MGIEAVVGIILAVLGVNVATVIGAAWKMGGRLARIETKLERVEATNAKVDAHADRIVKLEVKVENHDDLLKSLFERCEGDSH